MKEKPFFSVCIPAYNVSSYIGECLDSVARQTCRDWEMVIIDDGSTDETLARIEKWREGRSNVVKVLSTENRGLYAARGTAYDMAEGEIIVNVDSDDFLVDDEALEKLQVAFRENDVEMVFFNACMSPNDRSNGQFDYSGLVYADGVVVGKKTLCGQLALGRVCNAIWAKAFRRSLCLGGVKPPLKINLAEDRLRIFQIALKAEKTLILDDVLYCYRQNRSSITHQSYGVDQIEQECFVEEFVYRNCIDLCVDEREYADYLARWFTFRAQKVFLQGVRRGVRVNAYRSLCRSEFCKKAVTGELVRKVGFLRGRIALQLMKRGWIMLLDTAIGIQLGRRRTNE